MKKNTWWSILVTTDEIMIVANVITEKEVEVEQDEVLTVVFVEDGKVSCDVCGKRYKASGFTKLFIKKINKWNIL